jgi:hypothetical protein
LTGVDVVDVVTAEGDEEDCAENPEAIFELEVASAHSSSYSVADNYSGLRAKSLV